jgi:hypothetical protein
MLHGRNLSPRARKVKNSGGMNNWWFGFGHAFSFDSGRFVGKM